MPATSRQTPSPPDLVQIPRRRPLGGLPNVVLAVLAIAVAAVASFTLLNDGTSVQVPDLGGLTVEQARARAAEVGLTVSSAEAQLGGKVAGQDPPPGATVDEGSDVRLSLGPDVAEGTVPDLGGLTTDEARRALGEVGLHAGALLDDTSSRSPEGTVTRQEPGPGTVVAADSSVALWVASPASTRVPDMLGLSEEEARDRAAAVGLDLTVLREVTDEVLTGLVFEQSPGPGEPVVPGTTLVVIVNAPPPGAAGGGSASDDGEATGGTPGEPDEERPVGPIPAPYGALAAAYPFTVLYPLRLPSGMVLDAGPGNPRQVSDQQGDLAFEVRYVDPNRPGRRLALLEGGLFELGLDEATTVDVRGFPGSLGTAGATVVMSWQEGATHYMISAEGLDPSEVVAFASQLVAVPSP